jgi:tryptophan-rich hypothetical protein
MSLTKKYLYSKWTSVKKINGWRHYEVKNVFIKNKELEIFSVCDKDISLRVKIADINDKKKWVSGWNEIVL